MAKEKDWREKYKEKDSSEEESSNSNWRDKYKEYNDYNSAKIVGEKVTSMLEDWQKNYNSYVTDYTNRFSKRKGSYEDAYVGDSFEWLNAETEKRSALKKQEDDILAYLNQYGGHLDSKWVKQVFDAIEQAKNAQYKIHSGATKDNEYWNSFGTDELLKKYGSAEEAYKYYQRADSYGKKYSGLGSEDLSWAAGFLEDGEEKEWLNSYASQKAYTEKSEYDVVAGEAEVKDMEDYALWVINELKPYSGYQAEYNKRAKELWSKYGVSNAQEMYDLIKEKKQYVKDAARIQKNIALASVNDDTSEYYDPAFKKYADPSKLQGLDKTNLSKEEQEIYSYYYNKYGAEKANEYLDSIMEAIAYRNAERKFSNYEGNLFLEQVFAVHAGIDQAFTGLSNLFSDKDYISTSSTQYLSGMIREDLKDDGFKLPDWMGGASSAQVVYDLLNTSANMAPSMVAGSLANMVAPGSGAIIGAAMMGGSAAGNAYQEALNAGYDKDQARMYSTLVGASEAGLQYLMGGIGKLGSKLSLSKKAATTLASKFNNAYARLAVQYGTNMLSEGVEEYLQEVLTPVFKNLAFGTDEDVELLSEEAIYSFLLGALTSGFMETSGISSDTGKSLPGHLIDMSSLNKKNKQAVEMYGDATADLVKKGLESDSESEAHELAEMFKRKLDKGKKMSGYEIRQQIAANDDIARINNKLDATNEAAKRLKELGETSDVGKIATLVAKNAMGQKLTDTEKSTLVRSKYGSQVAKEMRDAVAQAEKTAYKPLEERVEDETPAKVSDTGKAVISGTDQQVDLTAPKIKKITADSVILEVDGKDVDMDSIEFANEDQWNMFNALKKIEHITPAVASDMIAKIDTSKPIWGQMNGMDEAFTYGYWNYSEADLDSGLFATYLTNKQQNDAYKLGQYVRKNEVKVDETNRKRMRTAAEAKLSKKEKAAQQKARIESDDVNVYFMDGKSTVKFDEHTGKYDPKRTAAVNTAKFLKKLGIGGKFVFYESYERNGKRYYKDKNGVERPAPNGFYDPADGSIYIDLNAGNDGSGKALFTMGHELAHFVKHRSEKQFKILSDMVTEAFDKTNLSMHKRVLAKQEFLQDIRGKGEKVSYPEAYEEVVADAMSTMLTDGSFYDTLMEIKVKDKGLFATIKKFFTDMIAKFKEEYKGLTPDQQDAQDIRELKDCFNKIQKAFAEGLVEASENFQAEQTQKNTTEDGGVRQEAAQKRSDRIVDQMKRSMDSIMAMEPVASINKGNAVPFLGSTNENYTAGGKVFKSQGSLAVREGYGTVQLTVNGAKESVFHGNGPAKQATFPAIKAVIEQGIEVGRDYNHNGKGFDTVTFAAPIDFFGHKESLGVVVKEFNSAVGEKNFYVHEICDENGNYIRLDDGIVTVKEKVASATPNPKSAADATYKGNSPAITVAQHDAEVKNKSVEAMDVEVDVKTESVAPTVLKSERTWTSSDYVQEREKAAKEIAKAIGVTEQKAKDYIDSVNSIAKMIAEDRSRLDYFSSPNRTSFVGNVEYGGSFDFSTLCKKRRLLTGTFTAIQKALPNTALTADEILDIRNRMKEANLEVSCGLCYVEGSRANMGQFAKEFLRLYKQYYPDAWQPNMADVNTPDGIEWVRINHPECYEQYEYFWNHYGTLKEGDKNLFASQQKPKLYQLHTEYKGEILDKFKDDDNVEEKNLNGGIRLQSFSDFEIVHLIDTMQIIMDMSRVGLAGQAYTKVPDFAWALGDTGLKINLSLIAKGVDENGKLIFDDVEGMPIADAMKLRDRYSKNVGTILVAFNDEQLLAAMADERVDFIIPFHRSQWKKSQYEAMGLPAKTKDYTFMQNEKYIKPQFHEYRGRMVKDKATNYMPNEYWDFSKSGKENAEAYLEMCARNNKRPKFYKLLQNNGDGSYSLKADGSTDGYWKLLIDFKMYDNEGTGSPQMAVKPEFNMEEANRMLNDYKGGHSNFPVAQGIVDGFVKDYKASHKEQKFSERDLAKQDRAYLDAVNRGDTETAQKMVDEAAKKAGYNSPKLYHGTNAFGFTTIQTTGVERGMEWSPFFAASNPNVAMTYSGEVGTKNIGSKKRPSKSIGALRDEAISRLNDTNSYSSGVIVDKAEADYFIEKFGDLMDSDTLGLMRSGKQGAYATDRQVFTFVPLENGFTLNDYTEQSGNYGFYANIDNFLVVDGTGRMWFDIKSQYGAKTRTIAENALKQGYQGVIIKNLFDTGMNWNEAIDEDVDLVSDVYIFFDPQAQVKSADPVTYDDNGNVIPLSQRFNAKNDDIRYSERGEDSSNRGLLANAFEGITKSSIEYKMIQEYKGHIKNLNALEKNLSKLNEEIRKIYRTPGKRDTARLKKLTSMAEEISEEITRHDRELLSLEASEPLRKVLQRERKKEAQKTKAHVQEIQQNRKVRAEQTELRHKIRKTIRDLDKILNRGNKKQNVKEDMKGFASKALELADYLFTDHISNDDLIRNGITVRMTPKEAALVKETEDILSKLYDHADSLTDEEFTRLDTKRKANEEKLRDLLTAQRNERLNTPVYNLFNDLVTEYAGLKNSKQDAVKAAYDAEVERFLRSYIGETNGETDSDRKTLLQNMRVADMTTEELWKLHNAYKMVLHSIRKANELHVKGKAESIESVVSQIVMDFGSRKIPEKKAAIALQKLTNKIGWDYEKLYYALDRIGSEAFTELIMNIANSENIVMQDVMEAAAFRDQVVEKHGFNSWDVNKKIDREFMDNTGKKFTMTLGQLMSLYAYSRREGAWDHIEYGGFVFGEKALTDPKPANSYKLSKEQCEAITSLLTKEQKAYVEDMQKFLSETMGEKGNEVSMELYGIKMFGEKNYFPIHIAGQFKAQANESKAKAAAGFQSMSNAGFTHAQNPSAKAPFVLEAFNEVWADHVNEMSRYHGTVPALEDLRRVMNRSSYSEAVAESTSVKAVMENHFGEDAVQYFDNLYKEANSGAIQDKLQQKQKKLLSLFRKNSVAYSLSVIIQQPAAMVRAYAMIDRKYFGFKGVGALTSGVAKAVSDKWTKAHTDAYNEMLKYAPGVTMAKEIGGFDTATGGSIRSYLLDTNKSFKQSMKTENAIGKGKAVLDKVDNNAIANLPNLADKIAWIEIWDACKRETLAKHKDLAPSSDEFMQIVGDRFTEVIRATQVYDSIFAKSPMLKSKNLAVQYLVSFMNEPNAVANMVESAVRDVTRGDWKKGAKTAAVVVHSIIFTNVLKSIVYAMRDDDEDETYIEKYIEAIAGNMMDDFNALNYIPIARDVWSLAQGYDVERADMAIAADLIDAIEKVVKYATTDTDGMTEEQLIELDKKTTDAGWKLVESVAAFFGIPVKNIRREIEGVLDHARIASANAGQTTAQSAWDKVYDSVIDSIPFMSAKESKTEKLYDAIVSGDKTYIDRLKAGYVDKDGNFSQSKYDSAVVKALRENDPRIKAAAQANVNGNAGERNRIKDEIKAELGTDYANYIILAINAETSAIRNEGKPDKVQGQYGAYDFVEAVAAGDVQKASEVREDIISTYMDNGKTQTQAENSFVSDVKTGVEEAYSYGDISKSAAEKMLVEYADMDEEDAADKITVWDFLNANPDSNLSDSKVLGYLEFAESAGVSLEMFEQVVNDTKGIKNIKDEWGEVEVTEREQILEVIDSLPIGWKQKDAIYLAYGLPENKIWDVPW